MNAAERQRLKAEVSKAKRERISRARVDTYTPMVQKPDGEAVRVDERPMCVAKTSIFAARGPGQPCPFRAAPGSLLCGNHQRWLRESEAA